MYQQFITFYCKIVSLYIDSHNVFLHSPIDGHLSCLQFYVGLFWGEERG